jgi:hypothetical protein
MCMRVCVYVCMCSVYIHMSNGIRMTCSMAEREREASGDMQIKKGGGWQRPAVHDLQ